MFSWQQYNNPITLGTNAVGPLTIGDTMEYTAGGNPGVSGGINLNGNNLNVYNAPGRDKSFTINNAAITGTGSLTLNNANNNGSGSISIPANLGFTGAITNIGIGTNATLISGSFSNSVSAVVQNSATAPLSLSGNNNFGGTALVNTGTLILGTNALGTNATVTVASGATVNLNFSASVTNTIAGLVLNGSTAAAGVHNAATDPTYLTGTGNLLIPSGVANYSTNITFSVSGGGTLTLTWPATHLGWYAQSNSVDLSVATNWHDIPGSQLGTNVTATVDPTQPKMFYRLSNTSRP